ncbi:hypothetical protein AMTRI_Chr04g189890 [Amborella trichopoda]
MDLSSNQLFGNLPNSFGSLKALEHLNLANNSFQGTIPDSFTGMISLQSIDISSNKFSGEISKSLGPLRNLEPNFSNITIDSIMGNPLLCATPNLKVKACPINLCHATDNFNHSNLLGVGSSGSVCKGILSHGTPVAIKVLNLQIQGASKNFNAECKVMSKICHRNLVKIITTCSNLDFKALVLQFMTNGNQETWLHPQDGVQRRISLLLRLDIVIDVAHA